MKRTILIIVLFTSLLISCEKEDSLTFWETGTVIDYAGAGNCGIIIELDNGGRIQPMNYPDGFNFADGQRVLVQYNELINVNPTCDKGAASQISYIEELSCAPYVDLYFSNYDSLARDPVYLHDVYVDGNCLQIKISYSGGCKEHTVDLARMHPWGTGNSSVPTFEIRHNANGDMCEARFTKELRFDLTPLKQEGIKEFVLTAKLENGEMYHELFDLN